VVANVIAATQAHPTVEELYFEALKIDPKISLATVYRTVRLFEEAGIVEKHHFKDGIARYEEATEERHHHFIDLKNDKVIEFKDSELEEVIKKIAKKLGYKLVDHRLELYGVALDKE
jgi:Fur family ferric uptake transcriptional regulator